MQLIVKLSQEEHMGKKYGSIHIKTSHGIRIVGDFFAQYSNQPNEYLKLAERVERANFRFSFEFAARMRRYASIVGDELFIVITANWVSLYNRDMSFQTITQKARSLAKKFPNPILYTSNFDDDVFVFGLLLEGKTVTSGRICDNPEFYDVTTKMASMVSLRRILCDSADQPKKMPIDISVLEELLSTMMGVPLFTYEEDLEADSEHYQFVEERNGIRVYQKMK